MTEEKMDPIVAGDGVASEPAPAVMHRIEDLLTPAELAAVQAARAQALADASRSGARKGLREVVALLALHGFQATESAGALRIDVAPTQLRIAANTIVNALAARGVRFGQLSGDGPRIEGRYDVVEEAACLLIAGVSDRLLSAT